MTRSPPITAHLAAVLVPDDAGGHGGVGAVAAVEGEVVAHHDVDNVKTWQLAGSEKKSLSENQIVIVIFKVSSMSNSKLIIYSVHFYNDIHMVHFVELNN